MDYGLRDRVVLVTGAGGGAGPTLARAFAAEGAALALHHRSGPDRAGRAEATADEIREAGGRAMAVGADLHSTAQTEAMLERIAIGLGPVSVLVTATSAYRTERLVAVSDESWSRVLGDMLGATFRVCRGVVPGMQEAGWGRIVNVSARSALVGASSASHYAAAKAGIIGLTMSLAKELGPSGILVNAVAPTYVLTRRDGVPSIPDDRAADLAKAIPMRRIGTADDLAGLVLWLGSAANTYVTGETISLHGGELR